MKKLSRRYRSLRGEYLNSFHLGYRDQRLKELVNIRISQDLKEALDSEKERRGLDLSGTIRRILEESLKRGDGENVMQENCIY